MKPDAARAALGARIDQVKAELDDAKRQLADLEALVCHCHPVREHDAPTRPATYLHAADCIVTTAQQADQPARKRVR